MTVIIQLTQQEIEQAIRNYLEEQNGFITEKSTINFRQVGEEHMNGINVRCEVVGVRIK